MNLTVRPFVGVLALTTVVGATLPANPAAARTTQEIPGLCAEGPPRVASPPPDSPTLFTSIELCFPTQADMPRVDVQTYLYLMKSVDYVSLPSQARWTPFDESVEQVPSEQRLMDSGLLIDLEIEILDDPYPNGIAGKRVVFRMEERWPAAESSHEAG